MYEYDLVVPHICWLSGSLRGRETRNHGLHQGAQVV